MEDADNLMQQWAYQTFDGDDIPLCDVVMVKLPDGYNGFFIHMDHRLIDSCGLVVMINDLMQLYTHYKFQSPYPQKLADYEEVLVKDLNRANNEKRFAKDKKFWDDQLDAWGEPLYSDIKRTFGTGRSKRKVWQQKVKSRGHRIEPTVCRS